MLDFADGVGVGEAEEVVGLFGGEVPGGEGMAGVDGEAGGDDDGLGVVLEGGEGAGEGAVLEGGEVLLLGDVPNDDGAVGAAEGHVLVVDGGDVGDAGVGDDVELVLDAPVAEDGAVF